MTISAEQIKAARAMLDWSQEMLAQQSGLSLSTVYNLEKGFISQRSAIEVRKALESRGFEFLGNSGLTRRSNDTMTYHGKDSTDRFYMDLLSTVKDKGCDIAAVFKSQERLARSLGVRDDAHLQRLEELSKYSRVRCLLTDARHSLEFIPNFQFRGYHQNQIMPWSTLIYDNKTVMVIPTNRDDFSYFVINSFDSAFNGMNEFDQHWNTAFPLIGGEISKKIKQRA